MIGTGEATERARALGVGIEAVERDYVLNGLLCALGERVGPFIFRGGTALARAYWPDHRLSEDLDLIAHGAVPDPEGRLRDLVVDASDVIGVQLEFEPGLVREGHLQSFVRSEIGSVKVDLNMNEPSHMPPEERRLDLPYRVFSDRGGKVSTTALPEILGNKWFMLDDRKEPRDLFDLWWGLERAGETFGAVAIGYEARYHYSPHRVFLTGARTRLRVLWEERLAHQVQHLPEFDGVYQRVLDLWDQWDADRHG